jgi:hypothetical protein
VSSKQGENVNMEKRNIGTTVSGCPMGQKNRVYGGDVSI